ncbi:E6 protein [Phocoena phocoena papillomavirus 1]|uniref:Protein E6 n=1 Tax=Phocoena phocoena papillomavirus 1 TaxID=706525 RepID=F2VIQ6_PSPV|nr:E6 protein [Phocoena phocoena papillomavirus 1]ADJ96341.1 E6 protein [Phocoena phocoena papillomavirus 1]
MAENSETIPQLCADFDLTTDELILLCIFCKKTLQAFDIWAHTVRGLLVVWRKGFPFAACRKCLEVLALVDGWRRFEYAAYASTVEAETGKPLGDIPIRCMGCFKSMTSLDKITHVEEKKRFHKIGGCWRGFCVTCIFTPPPLVHWFTSYVTVGGAPPLVTWGFDRPVPALSESSGSSWTLTTSSSDDAREDLESISSGRRTQPESSGESDQEGELFI